VADIFETLEQLAACLCVQIEDDGLMDPCFCGVVPGTGMVYGYLGDNCEQGVAWVRLEMAYPANAVGQMAIVEGNCESSLGADVEVGILRPMPVGDEFGNLPSGEIITGIAGLQIADAITMRKAISCCSHAEEWILGGYTPLGPEGGVVGGAWTINMIGG
jgi:hypothetical protein